VARTDDDNWDITESVGTTALGVAAARAAASKSKDPLIDDPFAQVFLDAAGDSNLGWFSATDFPKVVEAEPDVTLRMQGMIDYVASRTAFFDRFLLQANNAGVRQVVIPATGLDARAWRLPWLDGTTVYELDQPGVLEFKAATLRKHGARPRSNLVNVAVDLRQDWPAALQQAGFDASVPSAWTAEGLMAFLPATGQDLLFEHIQALTAPGSRIAVEALGPDFNNPEFRERQHSMIQRFRALAVQLGREEHEIPDVEQLRYFEDRTDVGDWLRTHGWKVSVQTTEEMMAGYNRHLPKMMEEEEPPNLFVSAER
jgi:methyltransferase (TIGR00027 family)